MNLNRKSLFVVTVFSALAITLAGCEGDEVSLSSDTAKNLACSGARAGNAAGAVSDNMRKSAARAIADSVKDQRIQDLARKVENSDTPEKLRATYDKLITKACGPEDAK